MGSFLLLNLSSISSRSISCSLLIAFYSISRSLSFSVFDYSSLRTFSASLWRINSRLRSLLRISFWRSISCSASCSRIHYSLSIFLSYSVICFSCCLFCCLVSFCQSSTAIVSPMRFFFSSASYLSRYSLA
jgi:hypothetical protein